MKNTFSKVTALALAGVMSFGTIAAVPMTALADEGPVIEAQAITSYYNYGDWRINQLERLLSFVKNNAIYTTQADENEDKNEDIETIEDAIYDIETLDIYRDWGTLWNPNRLRRNSRVDRRMDWDPSYPYDYDWDYYYNDYIRTVDNFVYSAVRSLNSRQAIDYFNYTLDREYWGYRDYNDYYTYWYNGRRYYTTETTTKTIASTNVYRLLNKATGEHAFTASSAVRDTFVAEGWVSEGTGWKAPESEGNAVYQLRKGTKYFYTKDTNERDSLVGRGYTNDGVAFYSYKENKDKPIYRLYNGNGKHFFTSNKTERDSLVGRGWKNEGVAFYAM